MSENTFRVQFFYEANLFTKRGHNKIAGLIMRQLGRRHRNRRMKKHFMNVPETSPGGGGYRYKTRSSVYRRRKQKAVGHNIPNIFTGELRQTVLGSSRITATRKRWTFTARSSFPLNADRRNELQAVSQREIRDDVITFRNLYSRAATRPTFQDLVRRRIR